MNHVISKYLTNYFFCYNDLVFDKHIPPSFDGQKIEDEEDVLDRIVCGKKNKLISWYESKYEIKPSFPIALECCKFDNLHVFKKVYDQHHDEPGDDHKTVFKMCIGYNSKDILKYLFQHNDEICEPNIFECNYYWKDFFIEHYLKLETTKSIQQRLDCICRFIGDDLGNEEYRNMLLILTYTLKSQYHKTNHKTNHNTNRLATKCAGFGSEFDEFVIWYLESVDESLKVDCFREATESYNFDLATKLIEMMDEFTFDIGFWLLHFARNNPDMIIWIVNNFNIVNDQKYILPCLRPCVQNGRADVANWLIKYFDISFYDQAIILDDLLENLNLSNAD